MNVQNGSSYDRSEIRTRATEVTGALNQRLRPLGHPAMGRKEALVGVTQIIKIRSLACVKTVETTKRIQRHCGERLVRSAILVNSSDAFVRISTRAFARSSTADFGGDADGPCRLNDRNGIRTRATAVTGA